MAIEVVALVIAVVSLVLSTAFSIHSILSARNARELSENQKTAALLSLLAPASADPRAWAMTIEYLAKKERLPTFSKDDEQFLGTVLERLRIKAAIVAGTLRAESIDE